MNQQELVKLVSLCEAFREAAASVALSSRNRLFDKGGKETFEYYMREAHKAEFRMDQIRREAGGNNLEILIQNPEYVRQAFRYIDVKAKMFRSAIGEAQTIEALPSELQNNPKAAEMLSAHGARYMARFCRMKAKPGG